MTTVAQSLADARAAGLDRLDADLLLLAARGIPTDALDAARGWLLSHDTDDLPRGVQERYLHYVQRRRTGEPLAYITGGKEFFGLPLSVDPRVLIPRSDTETLVEWVLALLRADACGHDRPALRLLDLGTGSGAIALALKKSWPTLSVDAVDASDGALMVARGNAERLGLEIAFLHGHWFEPVAGRYDCIVSNPPYVAEADPHLIALAHEPKSALVSGADGLRDIRHIVTQASRHLVDGGWLLFEHGFDQGPAAQDLMRTAGFGRLSARRDLSGHWRCSGGRWPVPSM